MTVACDNQGVDHTARQGLGLAKHVHTKHVCLQAARDEGWLDVVEIPTERKLVGVEYDQDTKTLQFSVPVRGAPAQWLALRQQVCQAVGALQHEVTCRRPKSRDASGISPCDGSVLYAASNSPRGLCESERQRRPLVPLRMTAPKWSRNQF